MAQINFGGVKENVVTREEFPLAKALEVLKNETIAVIGYGVQGPGQALNLKDNGFNVIVGQRRGSKTWDKAVADGWIPGRNPVRHRRSRPERNDHTIFTIGCRSDRRMADYSKTPDSRQSPLFLTWFRHHL